jgi:hypothetical protein
MKRWIAWVCAVVMAVGLGALFAPRDEASAYTFYMTKDSNKPLRWWLRPQLQFSLATVAPEEATLEVVRPLVEQAFDVWITTTCGRVPEVTFGGTKAEVRATTPTSLRAEPDNLIVFIRSASEWSRFGNSPTWIAITKIAHDPNSGEIVDADIEINDGGYVFSYDDSPAANEVDFLSMLTHELGHFYGLDHSLDSRATMFATYATSPADAMEARTLAQDDIDGVCTLYVDVPTHKGKAPRDDDCSAGGGGLGLFAGLALALRALARRPRAPLRA